MHDAAGRLREIGLPNGVETVYGYDAAGWLAGGDRASRRRGRPAGALHLHAGRGGQPGGVKEVLGPAGSPPPAPWGLRGRGVESAQGRDAIELASTPVRERGHVQMYIGVGVCRCRWTTPIASPRGCGLGRYLDRGSLLGRHLGRGDRAGSYYVVTAQNTAGGEQPLQHRPGPVAA